MATRSTRSKSSRRLPGGQLVLLAAAVVVVAAIGTLVSVRVTDDDSDSANPNDAYGVSHVHGLGINPADESLIVATHNGSFRIPAGSDAAERIGDSLQDTMGFTVVGPDHFLGSGHPDLAGRRAGQPAQLGLIESTDGGASWTNLSLGGEVDFHGLAYAHESTYGWDSGTGRLMVSTNRTDWETRSTLDMYGFAVDPADADHVIAAGPDGILDSTDGGRTWSPVGGPTPVALSWSQATGLWGVDANGTVYHHDSSSWTRSGEMPGEPQALLATTDTMFAAAHDNDGRTGIYSSTDAGATWALRYQDPAP